MRITLRDYQDATLDRIADAEQRGVRRQAVSAATGLGKTVIFSALAERRAHQGRTLVLAHRDELINQAVAKMLEVWPDAPVGVVKAERNEVDAQVVVASVQTLSRDRRLAQLVDPPILLGGLPPFDLVVVDECHHAPADTYMKVLDALAAGHPDGPLLLGVTATLDRGDGQGLDHIFDEVVADWPILWGIEHGYLAPLRGQRVHLDNLDLSTVKVTAGDFNVGQSGRALMDAGAPQVIAAAIEQQAADRRRILVFTPTVEVATNVAAECVGRGMVATWISGETPLVDRRRTLAAFNEGSVRVLANCQVLTEGYDEPAVDCVVVARPTKSRGLYTQMIGRGTRKHPEKVDCLVLDVVGNSRRHTLMSIPSLFGLHDPDKVERDKTPVHAALADQGAEELRLGRIHAEEADLFAKVTESGITWVPVHEPGADRKRFVRPLGQHDPAVVLLQQQSGEWAAGIRLPRVTKTDTYGKPTHSRYGEGGFKCFIRDATQATAQAVAEDYIAKHPARNLARANAAWRQHRPSVKLLVLAGNLRIPWEKNWTQGQVSDAVNKVLAVRNERQANARRRAGLAWMSPAESVSRP